MGSLSQAKTIGGVGALLSLFGMVPDAGIFFSIPGFIMVLIAVKYIAEEVGDKSIFNNMIIAIVTGITGMVIGVIWVFGSIFRYVGLAGLEGEFWSGDFWSQGLTPSEVPPADVIALIVSVFIGLLIIWVVMVISSVFMRKSYNSISTKLNVGMFGTVATLYLVGAVLSIILVGFLLIFVAEILLIVAFFSIPDQAP